MDDCVGGPTVYRTRVFNELAQIPIGASRNRRSEVGSADDRRYEVDVGAKLRRDVVTVGAHLADGSLSSMSPLEALSGDSGASRISEPIVTVTPEALEHLTELRNNETDGDQLGLRLGIASTAGEDFRYDLSFEEFLTAAFDDEVRTHDGLKVIIPGSDLELLTGATLDYTSTQGLVIRNPNKPEAPNVEGLTNDDELSAEIEALVAAEVNPALAAHGGFVTYIGHDGDGTAFLTMGGGCHGCSMSKMTMLDGVQTMLVEALPAVERVKDLTDHTTGETPFYS